MHLPKVTQLSLVVKPGFESRPVSIESLYFPHALLLCIMKYISRYYSEVLCVL